MSGSFRATGRTVNGASGIGVVSLDVNGSWRGGRYYLHHLVRSVAALPDTERLPIYDVAWGEKPAEDAFEEVRPLMAGSRLIVPPSGLVARTARKLRRAVNGWTDARDLFIDADISVLFPIMPCANAGVPLVFWLTDFQYCHLPELYKPELRQWFEDHNNLNVKLATRVVLSSRHAYEDFSRIYPQHTDKARILHFSSIPDPSWWSLEPAAAAHRHGIDPPYVIVCNQFAHNKNHDVVFAAMRLLNEQGRDVQLVCTGSTGGFHGSGYFERLGDYIAQHGLSSRIKILGLLPRAEQIALLRGALALVQPSRFEGWSTIIEDAKSVGQLVLASDFPVHREQLAGRRGQILPLDGPETWASAIVDLADGKVQGGVTLSREEAETAAAAAAAETGRMFLTIIREARAAFWARPASAN